MANKQKSLRDRKVLNKNQKNKVNKANTPNKPKKKKANKKKKPFFNKGFVIFLVLVSLVIVIYNVYKHPYFKISQVYIKGNIITSDEEIISLSGNPVGKSIFTYKDSNFQNKLEEKASISKAKIEKKYPDTINIEVKEIYPLMKAKKGKKTYVISNTGLIFDGDDIKDKTNLIRYYDKDANYEVGKYFTNDNRELEFLDKIQSYSYSSLVKELNFENKNDIGIIIGDIQVKFGDLKNMDYKLKLLDSVLIDIDQKHMSAHTIILNKGNNPVVEVDDKSLNQESDE